MQRKQFLRRLGALIGGIALGATLWGCGGGGDAGQPASASTIDTSAFARAGTLSPEEIAGLRYMREEEKLAHDVYVAMHALWGHRTFANIAESESTHTEAILGLLTTYGLADPAAGRPAGVFEDAALQSLHGALVSAGSASVVEGLKVGALIEETDIRDIQGRQAVTGAADILYVYDRLLCGSRNHLRAFHQALQNQGVSYQSQVIGQPAWDAIASTPREACGG